MHNLLRHFWLLFLGLFLVSLPALAEGDYRSKYGLDVSAIKISPQSSIGWVLGIRSERYLGGSNVYLGLQVDWGAPTGGSPADESIFYCGASFGYDGRMSRTFTYEFSAFAGYGQGQIKNLGLSEVSYFVVQPSIGIGFGLGGGYRLTIDASYLQMSGAAQFSGPMFGIRLDYRTQSKELND